MYYFYINMEGDGLCENGIESEDVIGVRAIAAMAGRV
jgi:hypothetical protein